MWQNPTEDRKLKEKRAGKLALFGVFTVREIAKIVGISKQAVQQVINREVKRRNEEQAKRGPSIYYPNGWTPEHFLPEPDRKRDNGMFNPKTLDALWAIVAQYNPREWGDGTVNGKLVRLVVQNGTSLYTVYQLTGIPLEELREAMNDSSDPGLLGAGT